MIAGRLELLLLLFIVVHGKVVTTNSGVATNSTCTCGDTVVATHSTREGVLPTHRVVATNSTPRSG